MHYDLGTNYYVILSGEIELATEVSREIVRGPVVLVFEPGCAFGITQSNPSPVEILVWIWQDPPVLAVLQPGRGRFLAIHLPPRSVESLTELHTRCRDEVALADSQLPRSLAALRELLDVEISRADHSAPAEDETRWKLACTWMVGNLAIHAPVPALCDYLRMSPSTLHRFFRVQSGLSPGACFRQAKMEEARRLVHEEGWQVKAVAHHLGYRHANDLSRALAGYLDSVRKAGPGNPRS